MTNAFARQQTKLAGARRGQRDSQGGTGDGPNEFAVLIRLPDLNESRNKEKATETTVLIEQDGNPPTAPEPADQPSVEEQPSERGRETVDSDVDERGPVESEAQGARDKPPKYADTTVLRAVLQGAIAVALIGTFITVYVLIVDSGGSGTAEEPGGEITDGQGTAELPRGEFSIERSESADIAVVSPLVDDVYNRKSVGPNAPHERNSGGAARSPIDGSQAGTLNSTEQVEVGPENALSNRQQFGPPNRGHEGDSSRLEKRMIENSHCSDSSPPGQTVNEPAYKYPVTHPSTFQYPENYHTRLLDSPHPNGNREVLPASGQRGEYGEYDRHRSARLQPRMQPPPMR
jgi:hypothetical protein